MKNSNHASKALAVVLSGALAFAPAANAALDESNMAYTSAAEGFYGSLRVQYANNDFPLGSGRIPTGSADNDSRVEAESSRLGVRGDVDLGGGLSAFYGFEWNLGQPANGDRADAVNGTGLNTRQNHVGLKGDWGSIWLGAFDSVAVRFGGFSATDILDQYSGNFEPAYRTSNAIAYISPDLSGFNFGIQVQANDGPGAGEPADDGNDFDQIALGASYSIQGLTFSGAYLQDQGEGSDDDLSNYALGLGYSQDNWTAAVMYGSEEIGPNTDAPFLSLAAGVAIDKLEVHGLWEQKSYETGSEDIDQTIVAATARYNLGSKATLRAGWRSTEWDLGASDFDITNYALGLRVDF